MTGTLLEDISRRVDESFAPADVLLAKALLSNAVTHDGNAATPRLQRCALVAAKGSIKALEYYVGQLKVDCRDVIVAGEYDSIHGKRVRDLNLPL